MQILPVGIVIFLALLAASASWAGEDQPDRLSQRWTSAFSGPDRQAGANQTSRAAYQANLTPTFYTRPSAPANLRELTLEGPRTRGLLATTTWLKGTFSTETEIAANQEGTAGLHSKIPGDTTHDPSMRMMRLGLTGSSGPVRFGMRYRHAGQGFHDAPDQALREVWSEWKQGLITLRSAAGQQWNNVGGDSTRARLEQQYGRVGLSWTKPAWPIFDVTYSRNALAETLAPIGIVPQRKDTHQLEAALGYAGASWTARLASGYSVDTDLVDRGSSLAKRQTLTASFRPLTTLTIAPTLGYRAEQQAWSGVRIDQPSASLAMSYKQSRRLLISALGNYSETRSSDRLIDLETMGGKGVVAWDVPQSSHWTTLLSLEGGYNLQINQTTSPAQTEDLSGLLRLVFVPL